MSTISGDIPGEVLLRRLADGIDNFAKAAESTVRVVDSHTEGEPTRLVVAGAPELGSGNAADRRRRMRQDHDGLRTSLVNEPGGNPAAVGVILAPSAQPDAILQAVYFNNVGYLTMCVHATIGIVHTLARVAGLEPGALGLETPAGVVRATLEADGSVSVENVPSRRVHRDVAVETHDHGIVRGDVAYGGNWFFVAPDPEDAISPEALLRLEALARDVRSSLERAGIRGDDDADIDHVYLTGRPSDSGLSQRNYVLCPGGTHDRSPCGTGTSANLACLADEGRLAPGESWRQESCIGTVFNARYHRDASGAVIPTINGRAHLTGHATLITEPGDPFPRGIS